MIHRPEWAWPDGFAGAHQVAAIRARGVDEVRELGSNATVDRGTVDVGKRLRPNVRQGRVVLFVERVGPVPGGSGGAEWRALKLP